MTRAEIREFLKTGAEAVSPVYEFGSGLLTEFNAISDKSFPQIWWENTDAGTLTTSGTNPPRNVPVDEWNIRLHVAKQIKVDDVSDNYEPVIDECDLVAQKLMAQYNFEVEGYKLVTLTNRTRAPFVKKHAHCMAGVILSFRINAPDTTEVCP